MICLSTLVINISVILLLFLFLVSCFSQAYLLEDFTKTADILLSYCLKFLYIMFLHLMNSILLLTFLKTQFSSGRKANFSISNSTLTDMKLQLVLFLVQPWGEQCGPCLDYGVDPSSYGSFLACYSRAAVSLHYGMPGLFYVMRLPGV